MPSSCLQESQADCTEDNDFDRGGGGGGGGRNRRSTSISAPMATGAGGGLEDDSDFFSISPDRSQPNSLTNNSNRTAAAANIMGAKNTEALTSYDANGNNQGSSRPPSAAGGYTGQLGVGGAVSSDLSDLSSDFDSAACEGGQGMVSTQLRRRGHRGKTHIKSKERLSVDRLFFWTF